MTNYKKNPTNYNWLHNIQKDKITLIDRNMKIIYILKQKYLWNT